MNFFDAHIPLMFSESNFSFQLAWEHSGVNHAACMLSKIHHGDVLLRPLVQTTETVLLLHGETPLVVIKVRTSW